MKKKKSLILLISIILATSLPHQESFSAQCEECCNLAFTNEFICASAGNSICALLLVSAATACCSNFGTTPCKDIEDKGDLAYLYREIDTESPFAVTCRWICQGSTGASCPGDLSIPTSGTCMATGPILEDFTPLYDCGGGSIFCP